MTQPSRLSRVPHPRRNALDAQQQRAFEFVQAAVLGAGSWGTALAALMLLVCWLSYRFARAHAVAPALPDGTSPEMAEAANVASPTGGVMSPMIP